MNEKFNVDHNYLLLSNFINHDTRNVKYFNTLFVHLNIIDPLLTQLVSDIDVKISYNYCLYLHMATRLLIHAFVDKGMVKVKVQEL